MTYNMNTFCNTFGIHIPKEVEEIIEVQKAQFNISNPQNLEEQAFILVSKNVYEKLIKGYTEKH